jgi:hypothetical protein
VKGEKVKRDDPSSLRYAAARGREKEKVKVKSEN